MVTKDKHFGDVEFQSYLDGLDKNKRLDVAVSITSLDLNTPEGVRRAKEILLEELDFQFNNAQQITGNAIRIVGELLKKQRGAEDSKKLYIRRVGPREYSVTAPPQEVMDGYKKEVERIVGILKTRDQKKIAEILIPGNIDNGKNEQSGGLSSSSRRGDMAAAMNFLSTGDLDEKRLTMMAIAILTGVNRSKGLTASDTMLKMLKAGNYKSEKVLIKDGKATCIDVSVLAKELARNFGIPADVYTIGGSRTGHRFLVTSTGEVLDGWSQDLFYPSFEEFKASVQKEKIAKEGYGVEID